jgi:glycosyltransferase involved in cell wall biosynthesis
MRVLFDHQIFSYQRFGGASRYYAELMTVFDRDREPAFDLGVAESPNVYLRAAPYYRGESSARPGKLGFLQTYARNEWATRMVARKQRHDILHTTFYDPGFLRDLFGAKLVVTVLDMIPEHFPDYFDTRGLYGRFVTKRWIDGKRALCERADLILAISEHTKRDVVAFYGIDPARIVVTHLGTRLQPTGGPSPLAEPYVLYVGTRNTYKNWVALVEGAAPLGLPILCVGGGKLAETEVALAERHRARIVQRDVRDDELAACYAHAAAFVFPSRYEGFGIPILEAFACGCPAIVADASCFPEIAGDAAAYFDPTSATALRAQLERVLGDRAYADELRIRGRARVARFTWEATAHATLAAYRAIARSGFAATRSTPEGSAQC